jgi:hypothetical protein
LDVVDLAIATAQKLGMRRHREGSVRTEIIEEKIDHLARFPAPALYGRHARVNHERVVRVNAERRERLRQFVAIESNL